MLKTINGTWFEFQHHNLSEGKYWNEQLKNFTYEQWQQKVKEISATGMKYLVIMNTAIVRNGVAESYYKTDIFPYADLNCDDPLEAVLSACDEEGMKVFVSCGFYGEWSRPGENMKSAAVKSKAFKAMEEIYSKYGFHESFFGWYLPDETCAVFHFSKKFISYVNEYSEKAKMIFPKGKILIAPYGTKVIYPGKKFISQLKSIKADYIAYQDEVGVMKSTPKQTENYFRRLRKAHDAANGPAIWADIEIFSFEGIVYRSALIPGPYERIKKQIESVSPYVDEILCYQYQGMLNKPGTTAFCGHESSTELFEKMKNELH